MSLLNKLKALLAAEEAPSANPSLVQTQPAQAAMPEPAVIVSPRVLVFVYDPIMDPTTGKKLSQVMNWSRAEDLSAKFVADLLETSGGLARYQIIKRLEINEFPVKNRGPR